MRAITNSSANCWTLVVVVLMICSLRSSLCPGEEVDDWVGHWAIHHQTLGTPGLAQLQVQKVNDQVDAVLSSNTGVAKMASVVADGDTLQLAYNVDIRGLTRVVELSLRRVAQTDQVIGFVSLRSGRPTQRLPIEGIRVDADKGLLAQRLLLRLAAQAEDSVGRFKARMGHAYVGRWLLTFETPGADQAQVTMGMIVTSRDGYLVVGLSGLNQRGPQKVIERFTKLNEGIRWTYPADVFGDLNMDIHGDEDSLSVVLAGQDGSVVLRGTGSRVEKDVDVGVDTKQLTEPVSMTLLGSMEDGARLINVRDSVVLLQSGNTVRAIIADDPLLVWTDVFDLPDKCRLIDFVGDKAWAYSGAEIQRLDVADDGTSQVVASCEIPGNSPNMVTTFGQLAYATNWNGKADSQQFHILDLQGTDGPRVLSSIDTPKGVSNYDMRTVGNNVYLASGSGLRILDVADPTHPRLVSNFEGRGRWVRGVDGSGSTAFIATSMHGDASWIQGIDVSSLSNPTQSLIFETGGGAQDVAMDGSLVYVADRGNGVLAVDVTHPDGPKQVAKFLTKGRAQEICVAGEVVVVSASDQVDRRLVFLKKLAPSEP